jgi:LuxR family maltose regulon positive regulatory protein
MDYLSEEIFNQQPAHIQEFLLQTSILVRLSGALCDAVIGRQAEAQAGQEALTSSQQVLEYLEQANLFLLPMDEARHWYRYHQLFGSLLVQRLRASRPGEIPVIQRRAATWCQANGYQEEALQYFLAAGDIPAAAELVEQQAMGFLKIGALDTLSSWLGRLPDEIVLERPWLSVYMSWVLLLAGNFGQIEQYLSAAGERAASMPGSDSLRGHITAINAYASAMVGEAAQAYELANQALDLLPPGDLAVRSVVVFVLGGINVMRGDITGAVEAMQQAGEIGERAGNLHLAVSALSSAGDLLRRQGRSAASEQSYMRALELSKGSSGQPLPIAASAYAGLAELYLDRHEMENARSSVDTALDLSVQWGIPENRVGCQLALARILHQEGDTLGAHEALNEAKHLAGVHHLSPDTGERIAAYEALILHGREDQVNQPLLVEPLSDRELEVLRLMARGLSNPEIAAELIVALGTVKAHSSSIYRKLDVRSRTEAVVKAGQLGLL